jgi:hypothetical protein
MEKLKSGIKFDEVARQYSEDKARSGVSTNDLSMLYTEFLIFIFCLLLFLSRAI